MGFFVENTGNLKWKIAEGDTLYNISKQLYDKSGQSVTVGNKTSSNVLDLKEIKTSGSSTKPYQIIATEIGEQNNNVSLNKLKIGQIIDVPDKFDVGEGRFSSLYSLTEPTSGNTTTEDTNFTPPANDNNLSPIRYGSSNLKLGSSGEFVTNLQYDLINLNIGAPFLTKATGVFRQNTQAAIKKFQGQRGLPQDGIVGERTKQALLDAIELSRKEPLSE